MKVHLEALGLQCLITISSAPPIHRSGFKFASTGSTILLWLKLLTNICLPTRILQGRMLAARRHSRTMFEGKCHPRAKTSSPGVQKLDADFK